MAFEALMEHVPRVDTETSGDHQGHGRPVQPQPDVESSQPGRETTTGDYATW